MSTRTATRQPHHATTDEPARDRDAWEFALLRGALARRLPVLGICRGAQVLNVALGGTLHQHLPDVFGHDRHQRGNAVFTTSSVRTVAGTRVAALIGESSDAQCYHHQAIAELGDGLIVSATDSGDGVIEAVELAGDAFCVAVQWHPEERLDDLRLFAGVVEAAREHATGGRASDGDERDGSDQPGDRGGAADRRAARRRRRRRRRRACEGGPEALGRRRTRRPGRRVAIVRGRRR